MNKSFKQILYGELKDLENIGSLNNLCKSWGIYYLPKDIPELKKDLKKKGYEIKQVKDYQILKKDK